VCVLVVRVVRFSSDHLRVGQAELRQRRLEPRHHVLAREHGYRRVRRPHRLSSHLPFGRE